MRLPQRDSLETMHHNPEDPTRFYYKYCTSYFYKRRLETVYNFLGEGRCKLLLEIGYGSGVFMPALSEKSQTIVGLDYHNRPKRVLKLLAREKINALLLEASVEALPFKDECFDTIVCVSVLEHVPNVKQALLEIRRVLKPKGLAAFGVPIENFVLKIFFFLVGFHYNQLHVHKYPALLNGIKECFVVENEKHFPMNLPVPFCLYTAMACRKQYASTNVPSKTEQLVVSLREAWNKLAPTRTQWKLKNLYYHKTIERLCRDLIPRNSSVLDIGCGNGDVLTSISADYKVGVDFSFNTIREAQTNVCGSLFLVGDAARISLKKQFDYIIISDTIGTLSDVWEVFRQLINVSHQDSRIVVTYYNDLWEPLLKLAECLQLKMRSPMDNWLSPYDVSNIFQLAGFEVIRIGYQFLLPLNIPLISNFVNRFIAHLPFIEKLCLVHYVIARPSIKLQKQQITLYSVSVIIPCRNEAGNIAQIIQQIPMMGSETEIIFVDGNSDDGTVQEIEKEIKNHPGIKIKLIPQGNAAGKGDAVRKGFTQAVNDILMILDADLTVVPKDLLKFYSTLVEGKGDFANGSRFIYPLNDQSMRYLNLIGNKLFSLLFTWLLGQRITDTLCGTKALFRRHYKLIAENRDYFGDFDPFGDFDLLFGASKLNLKIIEVPVRYWPRTYGKTKISRFRHGWLLFKMSWIAAIKLKCR